MRSARRKRQTEGLTLVEAAIIVSIVGVVLAVFVPTFVAHIRTSKVSEASEQLAVLHRATATYFATRQQTERGARTRCLPEPAGPAPAEASAEPVTHDFDGEEAPGAATWRALSFQPERPVRYRYTFAPTAHGCALEAPESGPLLILRAEGDLDGDGKRSLFEREATVGEDGTLQPIGVLYMLDRVE